MVSQKEIVLEALKQGPISSRDAVLHFGIQDLPKRISELRREGHEITSHRVDGKNRRGTMTHWNEYALCEPTSTSR